MRQFFNVVRQMQFMGADGGYQGGYGDTSGYYGQNYTNSYSGGYGGQGLLSDPYVSLF